MAAAPRRLTCRRRVPTRAARALQCDQAALTGESLPVKKFSGDVCFAGALALLLLPCCTALLWPHLRARRPTRVRSSAYSARPRTPARPRPPAGSTIKQGERHCVVYATGMQTFFGRAAALLGSANQVRAGGAVSGVAASRDQTCVAATASALCRRARRLGSPPPHRGAARALPLHACLCASRRRPTFRRS